MTKTMRVAIMAVMMMVGVGAASAQMMDPTTGMMVDPATDPIDYMNVVSGQGGNAGMEAMANATAASNAMAAQQAQMDAMNASMNASMNQNNNDDDDTAEVVPSLPPQLTTPKPVIAPHGGKVAAGTTVTITDNDVAAVVYYTTNGKKPTLASARYVGPIVVSTKEKVQALAFDVNDKPSGVVKQTFTVKS